MCINCFGNHEAYHGTCKKCGENVEYEERYNGFDYYTCRNCRITVESTKFYTVFDDNN